jgi:predicted glycoside hydrolase/deacetylase ChbG (UPF0249 family)
MAAAVEKARITNRLLGYPDDARLLIVNADDFGECHSINEAIIRALRQGIVSSCTLMVPCPWSAGAIEQLRQNPDIAFGVHLTAICEHDRYRWGPLLGSGRVPSLVDARGCFWHSSLTEKFVHQAKLSELEAEFRAQIELVLAAGLYPTHLDSHCHVHTRRAEVFDMVFGLAREYGLAIRVNSEPLIVALRNQGMPASDYDVLDSFDLPLRGKPGRYRSLLRQVPPGLTEWGVHPGLKTGELQAMESNWRVRHTDWKFVTSPEARQIIEEEGITLLDFRPLQRLWRQQGSGKIGAIP